MTVSELIEKLKDLPPDSKVILQIDPEGNGYNSLRIIDGDAIYHNGDYWLAEDTDPDQWERLKDNPHCCVLSP